MPPSPTEDDYNDQRHIAREEGTALSERTDDLPPADMGHAARALADALREDLSTRADEIGVPEEAAIWERLDVRRAATYLWHHYPDRFSSLVEEYPWLAEEAETTDEGALGALADQF